MKAMTRWGARLALPVARSIRALSPAAELTVVGWHRVAKRRDGLSTALDDFRDHLDVLDDWGAHVIGLDEGVRLLAERRLPERAVALTFDDGYASVVELAWPELQDRGWPATLFAVSGYLDARRPFPWDADQADAEATRLVDAQGLRDAAGSGLDVGSHTVTHAWLPRLSPPALDAELTRSREHLEDLLGRPVSSLAYPTGGWNHAVRDAAARAGYRVAVTCDQGRNRRGHDPLALRRSFVFDRAADFRLQLAGAFGWARPIDWWRLRRAPAW